MIYLFILTFALSANQINRSQEDFSYAIDAFQAKCTTCHSSECSLQSEEVLPSYWYETTERMQSMTHSGISREEAAAIAEYLIYDASTRRKELFEKQLKALSPEDARFERKALYDIKEKYGG